MGVRPKRLKGWVGGELKAVEVKCAQRVSNRFGDLTKNLVHFLTKKDESLSVRMEKLCILVKVLVGATKTLPI